MSIREKILESMREEGYEPQYKEELAIRFRQNRKSLPEFYRVLDSMVKEGVLDQDRSGKYAPAERSSSLVEGVFSAHARGFGFVVPLTGEERDLHVEREYVHGAMNGDRVLAKCIERRKGSASDEGSIVEILERRNHKIVGTYLESGSFGFVVPLNDKIAYDFYVPPTFRNGATSKQRVVLEITSYPEGRRNPEGKIVEILGFVNEKGTDILSVVREKDIPDNFSEETMSYAASLSEEVVPSELKGRTNYTDLLTFTIDGSDAKDFDDAVSCERLENGSYLLGVHIADVSHYVKEGTAIDKDAEQRGNSVYLLSKVVPMLPEKLSNGLCSLKEGVIRLTLSIMMEIDKKGEVVASEIRPAYIRSRRRLIYDDVSDLLETGKTEDKDLPELSETLERMEELYRILNEKRRARGTIEFEFPETLIDLDENDRPMGIRRFERRVANRLIEEFMLVANETIAEIYEKAEVPFLYRVHEEPDAMKMLSLSETVSNLGYSFAVTSEAEPKDLQALMDQVEETKDGRLIHMLVLRSLRKARYAEDCLGHFGLAVDYYTHFTSPIRRYSDLMIHRIIKEILEKKKFSAKRRRELEKRLPKLAEHLSATERRAEDADITTLQIEDLNVLRSMNLFSIRTSLYGASEKTHDRITEVFGSFEKTFNNIKTMKNLGIPISASCTIMRHNLTEINELNDMMKKIDVNISFDFRIIPSRKNTKPTTTLMIEKKDFKTLYQDGFVKRPNRINCNLGGHRISIDSFGRVYLCDMLRISIGNIKTDNLLSILQTEKANFLKEKSKLYDPDFCGTCRHSDHCTRCPGFSWSEGNTTNTHCDVQCLYCNIAYS